MRTLFTCSQISLHCEQKYMECVRIRVGGNHNLKAESHGLAQKGRFHCKFVLKVSL